MSEPTGTVAEKPHATIFYSWQSDLSNRTNRGFIRGCLDRAIKELGREGELSVTPRVEQDTQGTTGSPDIPSTIFEKIERCAIFVGDVTIINGAGHRPGKAASRPCPNPNVLLELGYAAKHLGWNRVLCVANLAEGERENLPFDLRQRKVLPYSLKDGEDKASARKQLVVELKDQIGGILSLPTRMNTNSVRVHFFNPDRLDLIGTSVELTTRLFEKVDFRKLPVIRSPLDSIGVSSFTTPERNSLFYKEMGLYFIRKEATNPVTIGIQNASERTLHGVRLVLEVPIEDGLIAYNELPEKPKRQTHPFAILQRQRPKPRSLITISTTSKSKQIEIEFGKIQIGETSLSPKLYLGVTSRLLLGIPGKVFSDEFPPQEVELTVNAVVTFEEADNDQFKQLLDHVEDE